MSGSDWKATLATVPPVLATALGGPLAGVAVKMAADALGLPAADVGALEQAIAGGDPSVLVKLKEVENNFKLEMKRLDVDVEKMHTADRDSARQLGIAKGIKTQAVLSAVFIVGFFVVFGVFINATFAGIQMPVEFISLISALIGIMASSVMQIMNFWFGSSSGSKEKTIHLVNK